MIANIDQEGMPWVCWVYMCDLSQQFLTNDLKCQHICTYKFKHIIVFVFHIMGQEQLLDGTSQSTPVFHDSVTVVEIRRTPLRFPAQLCR